MDIETLRNAIDSTLRDWSWQLSTHYHCETPNAVWVVAGKLTDATGIRRDGVGMAETPEQAARLALEQAARLFGVDLQRAEQRAHTATERAHEPPPSSQRRNGGRPVRSGGGITERQANAIMAISRVLGWPREQLLVWLHDEYEVDELEHLTKAGASSVIEAMQILTATTS